MIRRVAVGLGIALVVLGALNFVRWHWDLVADAPPVDFDLNWVAAHRLVDREPLYDRAASREQALDLVGPDFVYAGTSTYTSFIGSPATALLHVPFTALAHDDAVTLGRITDASLMLVAIVITGFALPARSRLPAVLIGIGTSLWSYPFAESVSLGQVDGVVMVAIAVAIWASVRERWRVVGVALGVAALVKLSPALLLVYLVLRGRRAVVLPAVASAGALLAVSAAVGRPADVVEWATDVVWEVAKSPLAINNQSVPAWFARLFGSDTNWLDYDTGLGSWRLLGWVVVVAGTAAVFLVCRRRGYEPLELGAVLLVALLAGPLSWDHYATWALLAIVLVADLRWWERRPWRETVVLLAVLAAGSAAMRKFVQYPTPDDVAADWTRRVESGTKTVGLLAYLAVAVWLLARRPAEAGDGPNRRLEGDAAGAEGLHAHG